MVANFADACNAMFGNNKNANYFCKTTMNTKAFFDIQNRLMDGYKKVMTHLSDMPSQVSSEYAEFMQSIAGNNNPEEIMSKVNEFYLARSQKALAQSNEMYNMMYGMFCDVANAVKESVSSGVPGGGCCSSSCKDSDCKDPDHHHSEEAAA